MESAFSNINQSPSDRPPAGVGFDGLAQVY
jgi:hypothetical protein